MGAHLSTQDESPLNYGGDSTNLRNPGHEHSNLREETKEHPSGFLWNQLRDNETQEGLEAHNKYEQQHHPQSEYLSQQSPNFDHKNVHNSAKFDYKNTKAGGSFGEDAGSQS